jgi:CRP/FNR family transcriptional regulator
MPESSIPFSDLLTFLEDTQLFQGLPPEQLAAIAQIARTCSFDKGETVFHQGDNSSGFFLVQLGRIKVYQLSASGREQILHVFGPGDHFAEVPMFDGKPFPASAAALEPTESLFFPKDLFLNLLEQHPTLTINMLKGFARHLRRFSQLIDSLSLQEVPGRLATYLLMLSEKTGGADSVKLDLNKGQLAARLGTVPETLSRVFYRLSRDGVLAVEGTRVTILKREALQQLME